MFSSSTLSPSHHHHPRPHDLFLVPCLHPHIPISIIPSPSVSPPMSFPTPSSYSHPHHCVFVSPPMSPFPSPCSCPQAWAPITLPKTSTSCPHHHPCPYPHIPISSPSPLCPLCPPMSPHYHDVSLHPHCHIHQSIPCEVQATSNRLPEKTPQGHHFPLQPLGGRGHS